MNKLLVYSFKPKNLILNFSILIGAFVLGSIIHAIIQASTNAETVFPFGSLMMFFGLVGLGFFSNWQEEVVEFQLSVSMGCTRRKFFISYALQYFLLMFLNWVVAFALSKLEAFLLGVIYSNKANDLSLDFVFHPATFFLVPFFITCFALFIGGMGIRFGGNSKWIVIVLWVAFCVGLSKLEQGRLFIKFLQLPGYAYAIIAFAVAFILGLVAVLLMRKQRVDI